MSWEPQLPPAELAESRLITAILDGTYPVNSNLPAERELAGLLGVTRPTLREVLQRLACDGWVAIQHGRSTRVRDYCCEGNIAVLGAMARHQAQMPPDFVPNLLQVRTLLAPAYT
ncbi:MAG TPA: GntR family transcriptional regulator, partial [Anaerolineaceae bacterium]|nr:GntR family transcriptional regulator [Anaerolineaceae bacterium]